MLPIGIGMQRAGHGGVDDLVIAVGQDAGLTHEIGVVDEAAGRGAFLLEDA
jgi:hypothetical protein